MITKATDILFYPAGSQGAPLVILRAQVHPPCFRYHFRESSRPFRMYRKESRPLAEDQRHVALTRNISHLIWGRPRPSRRAILPDDRIFSRPCFHLARGARAIAVIPRIPLVFDASCTAARQQTFPTIARREINPPEEGVRETDRSNGSTRERERSIAREREA